MFSMRKRCLNSSQTSIFHFRTENLTKLCKQKFQVRKLKLVNIFSNHKQRNKCVQRTRGSQLTPKEIVNISSSSRKSVIAVLEKSAMTQNYSKSITSRRLHGYHGGNNGSAKRFLVKSCFRLYEESVYRETYFLSSTVI